MTTYTLIILWSMGTSAAQHVNIPGFETLEKCQAAGMMIQRSVRNHYVSGSFCLEVMR